MSKGQEWDEGGDVGGIRLKGCVCSSVGQREKKGDKKGKWKGRDLPQVSSGKQKAVAIEV